MSTLHWLSADQKDEWDAFVTRHPLGLVYHLSSWQRAIETAFGHIRGRFLVLRDGTGEIQAGLPLYTVTSWLLGNRLVSLPFATICDPLISTKEEFSLLWPAIEQAAESHRCRRIEIRTRHLNAGCFPAPFKVGIRHKHHYLLLNKSMDELFLGFHKTTIRQRVTKAKRAGVVVEARDDVQSLRILHALLVATRRRRSLPPIPFAFFQAMHRWLGPDRVSLYLAIQAGEPIGGLLALKFKDLWTAEYSCTADNAISGVGPLLYWEAIQCAMSSGAPYFSFGRTSLANTGLLDHKRRWATVEEDLAEFISWRNSVPIQSHRSGKTVAAGRYRRTTQLIMRCAPAPIQKVVGDFCYRHLG